MLAAAIVIITLALVFYTIGVWSERVQGILKPWHAVMFGIGFVCDAGSFPTPPVLPSRWPGQAE